MGQRDFLEQQHNRIGPAPGSDPVERLRHVVMVYVESDTDDRVITATMNIYRDQPWTGLTHGDLRALLTGLDDAR